MTVMQSDGNEIWQMCPPLTIPEDSYVGGCAMTHISCLCTKGYLHRIRWSVMSTVSVIGCLSVILILWFECNPPCVMSCAFHDWGAQSLLLLYCARISRLVYVCVCVFVCIYAHIHPPRTLYCLGLSPAISPPSSALSWQIAWISAACLRNNTSHQVDRGAPRSQLLFLPLWDVYIQSSRSLSQQWSCIQWGFREGVGGRRDVSAPLGNKGHLFNLRCGGSLLPECVVIRNVV